MSQLQVTTITTVNNTTPLILQTGNTGGGQIILQASNNDVQFVGPLRFTANVVGDGSGLTIPSSNVANAAFAKANAALANASGTFAGDLSISGTANVAFNMRVGANLSFDNIDSVRLWEPTANTLTFHTASTERMRIDASGNTLIGTATSRNRLTVSGPMIVPSPVLGVANGTAIFTNSDTNYGMMFGSSGTGDGWIQQQRVDGTATAYNLLLNPAGGNVGIGVTSPGAKLNVRGGRTYLEAASEPYSLYVAHNSATSGVFLGGTSTGGLQISNAGGAAWVNVDSSGRVTMPFMPAFWAYGSGTQSWSGAQTPTKVNFSSGSQYVTSNKSGGWSQANSRFTAPVAGTYEFVLTFALQAGPSTGPAALLYRNGSAAQEVCIGYYSTTYCQCTGNMFIDLSVNDFVEFWISNYNGTSFSLDLSRCHFSGRLIG